MGSERSVQIWDLPLRLFHWLLAVAVLAAWYTAEEGEMTLHALIGKTILSLLLFRLLWGLYGSESARFARFLAGPRAVFDHFRALAGRDYRPAAGHNPAGGWMVLAMLLALALQGMMGLFGKDDIGLFYGPLAGFVSDSTSERIAAWHHAWFDVILALIALHILAVLAYRMIKGERLIGAMITGRKPTAAPDPRLASPWLALLLAAISFALVWGSIALLAALARAI